MSIKTISFEEFRTTPGPILDVRSPGEFAHGHIPGAVGFPLFSDEERALVGTCYKEQSRGAAIELGFDLIGPRLGDLVRRAGVVAPDRAARIHCWRGGLRSRGAAWCLQTAGFRVVKLEGGYKAYRRWAREINASNRRINILTGLTGTGKTAVLGALRDLGEQVLDLEGLANHRGSSFGGLGMLPQPSTEHFSNLIAGQLVEMDTTRPVWIESESRRVGSCWVPEELFEMMKTAPSLEIVRPIEERLDILNEMYGQTDPAGLIEATERIKDRLGGERTRDACELIREENFREAGRIILDYYDRTYRADLKRRPGIVPQLDLTGCSPNEAAGLLIKKSVVLLPTDPASCKKPADRTRATGRK